MAKRSSCCISSSSWGVSNGCYHLSFGIAMMLSRVLLFLPCDGKDQVDGVHNSFIHEGCNNLRFFNGLLKTKESLGGCFALKNFCFESSYLCFPSTLKLQNLIEDRVKTIMVPLEAEVGVGFIEPEGSFIELKTQEDKLTNARTGYLNSIAEKSLQMESKFSELLEADKLIFRNWKSQGTMSNLSVLKDHEFLFPAVQITTQFFQWIAVHNPSQKPFFLQHVLNLGAIIASWKFPIDSFRPSLQIFCPLDLCKWRSSAWIRNNLSGVEWLSLLDFGGAHFLHLFEGPEPIKKLILTIPNLSNIEPCYQQLFEELHAAELPLEVIKLEVSGTDYCSDGYMRHNCEGFSLASEESLRLIISYQADFSSDVAQRDLKLDMDSGLFVIPMEANLPIDLMDSCKNSLFLRAVWIFTAFMCSVLLVVCLLFFVLLHPIPSGTRGYSIKSEKPIATISRVEKPSRVHRNTKNARSIKKNVKMEEALVLDIHPCTEISVQENRQKLKENKESDHQKKTTLQSPPPPTQFSVGVLNGSDPLESPQSSSLKVKVVKERARRRKRRTERRESASTLEVSSSHSGNSTSSSPLSANDFPPISSCSSFGAVSDSSFGAVSEECYHANKQEFSSLKNEKSCISFCAPSSPIAPYARAPGSKLGKEKEMETEGDDASRNEYIYDIWGNNLSRVFDASEVGSQSFFAGNLQSIMMMSSVHSETSGHTILP